MAVMKNYSQKEDFWYVSTDTPDGMELLEHLRSGH